MSEWTEENFLESLARRLSEERRRDVTGTFMGRLSRFADLQRRLQQFDVPQDGMSDVEESHALIRLENWLKGFLASRRIAVEGAEVTHEPAALATGLQSRWHWLRYWVVALSSAAIVLAGAIMLRQVFPLPQSGHHEAQSQPWTPLAQPPTAPVPTTNAEADANSIGQSETSPPPIKKSEKHPSRKKKAEILEPVAPPVVSSGSQPEPKQNAESSLGSVIHPPERHEPIAVGAGSLMSSQVVTRAPRVHGTGPAMQSPAISGHTATTAPRPQGQLISLPAGTRIWLTFAEPLPETDNFNFQATVLLPLKLSGSVEVEKDAVIIGTGLRLGTGVELQIDTIVTRGTRYRQRAASPFASTIASHGKSVNFEGGKVLELWLESSAPFEPDGSAAAGPQN